MKLLFLIRIRCLLVAGFSVWLAFSSGFSQASEWGSSISQEVTFEDNAFSTKNNNVTQLASAPINVTSTISFRSIRTGATIELMYNVGNGWKSLAFD